MLTNSSPEEVFAGVVVVAVMLLVAFPIHEFAHALAAYRLGSWMPAPGVDSSQIQAKKGAPKRARARSTGAVPAPSTTS